jgi:UDP-glucuronate 4-epimerase
MKTILEISLHNQDAILVTGAAGFVGSHLVESLSAAGFQVLALDGLLETTYSSEIKRSRWNSLKTQYGSTVDFFELDLRDSSLVLQLPAVGCIINQAAFPGLDQSWTETRKYLDCNTIAVSNLLDYAKIKNVRRFIQASTSSVYGEIADGGETSPCDPVSPYGVSKLAAEQLIRNVCTSIDMKYVVLRYFSVYGPRQRMDMAYSKFIHSLLNNTPIEIFGDGEQTRTNTFINDVVEITLDSIRNELFDNQIVNVSGETEVSLLGVINLLENYSGKTADLIFKNSRLGDQRNTRGNIGKLMKIGSNLNFTPFEIGLAKQFDWTVENAYS